MKHVKLFEDFANEAKFKAGDKWEWHTSDGVKIVSITNIKPNGDVVGREDGNSEDFIVRDANKYLKKKVEEMASSDVHYKEIMDLYHSGSFAKKKVGAVVCKNPNATQKQIEDALGDADYEDMIEFIDALGINESHEDLQNYMFFSNLESIKRKCESILAMDFKAIDELLNAGGHDWAADHITVAKENIDQVENFLVGQFEDEHQEVPVPSPEDKFEPEV